MMTISIYPAMAESCNAFAPTLNSAVDGARSKGGILRLAGRRSAEERFYSLIWPHAATVLRTARYLVRNQAEADDVAQETMIKAFRAIERFQDGTDARAWLLRILRNTRIDHIRGRARGAGTVSLDECLVDLADGKPHGERRDLEASGSPEELLEAFSDSEVIEALHHLPEEIRWTLLLVDVEGIDHEEAAGILHIPVGTVKSRAFRGRAMLRKTLLAKARMLRLVS